MDIKKILLLSAIGLGIYFIISKKKAFAEEVPEGGDPLSALTLPPTAQQSPEVINEPEKITASLPPEVSLLQLASTLHSYEGKYAPPRGGPYPIPGGENSIDGNFLTYFGSIDYGGDGGIDIVVNSEHTFAKPSFVKTIKYYMAATATAHGRYTRNHSYNMYVQYQEWGSGNWIDVPGSRHSGGGGDGEASFNTDIVSYELNKGNIQKIRAFSEAHMLATGGEGFGSASAFIYELQAIGHQEA